MNFQFFLPVTVAILLFILLQVVTRKNLLNNNHFVRIRILLGCIYVGYLLTQFFEAGDRRSIVLLSSLIVVFIVGVYKLQKKFFRFIDPTNPS